MGDTRLLGAENIVRDEPETEERSCKGTFALTDFQPDDALTVRIQ